jgi:hypothetical protein
MTLYSFVNATISIYQLIMASIISTFVPYIVCKLLKITSKTNVLVLHIILIFSVLTFMTTFNCVFIPALAHSITYNKMLTQTSFSFLYSYVVATIVIIILCMGVFFIFKQLEKFDKIFIFENLQEFEKNIKLPKNI